VYFLIARYEFLRVHLFAHSGEAGVAEIAHKIYFLRVVRRKNDKGGDKEYGFIDVLNHEIKMPKDMINLFVFCVLDIKSKHLKINIELDDGSLKEIKTMEFIIKNGNYSPLCQSYRTD